MTRDQELDAAAGYGRKLAEATDTFAVDRYGHMKNTLGAFDACRQHHVDIANGRPSSLFVPPPPPSVCAFIEG